MSGEEIIPDEPWRAAVASAVATYDYGDTIAKAWLETALGVKCPAIGDATTYKRVSLKFFALFGLFRDELLHHHKMALKSLGHGEYLVVQPRDQHEYALEQLRRGVNRAIRVATETIDYTDTSRLSLEEIRLRNDTLGRLAAFESLSRRRLTGPTT